MTLCMAKLSSQMYRVEKNLSLKIRLNEENQRREINVFPNFLKLNVMVFRRNRYNEIVLWYPWQIHDQFVETRKRGVCLAWKWSETNKLVVGFCWQFVPFIATFALTYFQHKTRILNYIDENQNSFQHVSIISNSQLYNWFARFIFIWNSSKQQIFVPNILFRTFREIRSFRMECCVCFFGFESAERFFFALKGKKWNSIREHHETYTRLESQRNSMESQRNSINAMNRLSSQCRGAKIKKIRFCLIIASESLI